MACLEDAPTDIPFTQRELQGTLRPQRDTAAGTDKVIYSMIREAGTPAHDELLQVINTSYDTGKLPASWKQANIVPIPQAKRSRKPSPDLSPQLSGEDSGKDGAGTSTMGHGCHTQAPICLYRQQRDKRLHCRNANHHIRQESDSHIHGP